LLLFAPLTAGAASTGHQTNSMEKGTKPMQPAATAPLKSLPPLDVSQPSRVETFTFGLG